MMFARRLLLVAAAAMLAVPTLSGLAFGQAYPARPVQLVVPFPAGSPTDVAARVIAQWLTERIGQPVVIDNRPGGGGNIGSALVARAQPDGYTLLLCSVVNSISAALPQQLNYDFVRDLVPVSGVSRAPYVMVVHPSVPAKTVPEFIAWARANPGKVNLGSSGEGSPGHLFGEMFRIMAGVQMVHVPYRGSGPMLSDLIGGQLQVAFDNLLPSIPHVKDGRLRGLGVTTGIRAPLLPELPTIDQSMPGYDAGTWTGLVTPKGTPAEVVERLNREINAGLADAGVRASLAALGASPLTGPPTDFGRFIAADVEKWAAVIRGNFALQCPVCASGCRCANSCNCAQSCCPN
jgi:tripartite-type tricarboxylate transporter receptor subunit TctC